MNAESVISIVLIFTGLSLLIIPLLPQRSKSAAAFILVLLNAVITSIPAIRVLAGGDFNLLINAGNTFGDVLFRIDPLSAWFILIINITLINGSLYGAGYMKSYAHRKSDLSLHWVMLVMFQVSMLFVCMLHNGFAFLIAWEVMTLSSLILLMFEHEKAQTQEAGLNYMVQMHLGVALLTIAFIWVFVSAQTTSFDGIASFFQNNGSPWVILLFFAGFGIKAGFIPMHTWLPYAHPAAPSHVSGIMSGVIVKMGIYGILRIAVSITHYSLATGILLVSLSAATTLYGILNASVHRDFKKLLAFCTTENIGIIGMGIGIGLTGKALDYPLMSILGFSAALLHTLNHSLYKSLLFFTSGNIYNQTHTRNMEDLGGLIRYMPHTAVAFLVGSLAIGGLPPFNGFISKFLIYSGFVETFSQHNLALSALMVICIALLSMAGGVSMLTFTKSFGVIFLGSPRKELHHKPEEVPLAMRLPLYLIIGIMLVIGLFPELVLRPLLYITGSMGVEVSLSSLQGTGHIVTLCGRASLLLLLLIAVIYGIRASVTRRYEVKTNETWGCGYVAPHTGMQYTGKSFSKSLAKLFGFITIEDKKYDQLDAASIFPAPRSYASLYLEFFEKRIFEPVIKGFLRIFNIFTFFHNGKIQLYVLYGLIFVVILILLSVFNVL
ncbi:MAG TPA: proton-conducting transporter membrane subunit [Bacteroidales bacterium]|nr:proton-conducting transporter membrane subunit [Bacteroidales bacterium]